MPVETGFFSTYGTAGAIYVSGNFAYLAYGGSGLRIIDVSNPELPVEEGFFDTSGIAHGVFVSGNYAYVADGNSGLRIIEVSNPAFPDEVGFYDTGDYAENVFVRGNFAYVADQLAGLRIIDVSNPALPDEVGFYDTGGNAWDVFVRDNYAYVADGFAGIQIIRNDLDVSGTGSGDVFRPRTVLYDTYPNPFNPQTTIAFEISDQQAVTMRIFDLSGRLVRSLITAEPHTPGRHEVVWNGRDDSGRQVASGTYFYRLEAGAYSETKRMVLIK
jgi:hypothetical protein